MMLALIITGSILAYCVGAGITHGYASTKWDGEGSWNDDDVKRFFAAFLWPIAILFIFLVVNISNFTIKTINKRAATKVKNNRIRIKETQQTAKQLQQTRIELQEAEEELERELQQQAR